MAQVASNPISTMAIVTHTPKKQSAFTLAILSIVNLNLQEKSWCDGRDYASNLAVAQLHVAKDRTCTYASGRTIPMIKLIREITCGSSVSQLGAPAGTGAI